MASNRLRKHLSNLDAEDQASATESFVLIGTPLPSLASKRHDPNEGKPIWEQEVRDEQGRRRFHGAFTGGWSAGYFNTVGSKEGWTPSNFVSSRSGRGEGTSQRPEDFMDDEDLAELDQGRHLTQRDEYSAKERGRHAKGDVLNDLLGLGGGVPGQKQGEADASTSANSGLVAPRSSLGHRILSKMGWKTGSGLGPLMTRARRRVLERLYIGGVSGNDDRNDDDKTLVPPPDTPMPGVVDESPSTHGLGWVGEKRQQRASGSQGTSTRLGLSSLTDDDEGDGVYGKMETVQDAIARRAGDALKGDGDSFRLASTSSAEDRGTDAWKDGRRLPPGFVVAETASTQTQGEWYPPPQVPSGWTPDPNRAWKTSKVGTAVAAQPNLKASDRASLLGEARIPGPPPTLSDYVPAPGPPPIRPSVATTVEAPRLDPSTAKAALNGFIPFGNNEQKQERYKAYLRSQTDASVASQPYPISAGQTAQQTSQELQEFARSANIFKPMSSTMASRFATAATSEGAGDVHAPTPGLYQPAIRSQAERDAERRAKEEEEAERTQREKEESMNDRQRAAKAGMFGHLTREVKDWFPPKLLCKRFGVPDPHPERAGGGEEDEEQSQSQSQSQSSGSTARPHDPFSSSNSDQHHRSEARREIQRGEARWQQSRRELMGMVGERKWEELGGQPIAAASQEASTSSSTSSSTRPRSTPQTLENVGLGEDAEQLREIDNFVKPPRSVFRSVFASDEEDDEDEVEQQSAAVAPPSTTGGPTFVPRSKRKEGEDESGVAHKRSKKKKGSSKRGALTFSMDDGDGDAEESVKVKPVKKSALSFSMDDGEAETTGKAVKGNKKADDVSVAAERPPQTSERPQSGRMRAADLF